MKRTNLKTHNQNSKPRRGVAAVECAVVLPMFLILTLGTIEMGTALRASTIMQSATREAGRLVSMKWSNLTSGTDTPNAKIERDLRNFVTASGLPGADLDINIIFADGDKKGQPFDISDEENDLELVKIQMTLPYSSISLFPTRYMGGKAVGASLVLRAGLGGGLSQ